ncbi:hypothetical protein C7M84_011002 [Penaeus vannamei]|uniref:imidazolonepropionase n=1 Tax=Penaeus vannamei TaxID=6689 RepID=A0A3R7Q7R8_PENVA|nr:hypothetical protein C7M84_011002 [Penaeus vannamei]
MARAGTVGVLLPTTAHILRLPPPPARAMIDAGVPVALGTDFNPNAFCLSMVHCPPAPAEAKLIEALTAATLHAAHSLRKAHAHGSIEPGKCADLVIVDAPRWEHLVYQLGGTDHVISHVIKAGAVVHERK